MARRGHGSSFAQQQRSSSTAREQDATKIKHSNVCELLHPRFLPARLGWRYWKAIPVERQRKPVMKVFVTVLALAALVATSAVAKTVKADTGNTYHSYAQGSQAYENPDRVYGHNEPPAE
jgi:hypothetical protein